VKILELIINAVWQFARNFGAICLKSRGKNEAFH
jgi:hypothetical protein